MFVRLNFFVILLLKLLFPYVYKLFCKPDFPHKNGIKVFHRLILNYPQNLWKL